MANAPSLLKGKRVLTNYHYGKVLNDAERENVIVLHAIRAFFTYTNDLSVLSRMAGVSPTGANWMVVDEVIAIPWSSAGIPKVTPRLPKFLFAHRLSNRRNQK